MLRQRIQPTTLVGGEPIGQPALDLATRLIAGLDAEPLEPSFRIGLISSYSSNKERLATLADALRRAGLPE